MPDGTSRPVLDRIVAEIQDFFLSKNKDPVEVYELYGLHYKKHGFLKQKQLKYWIKYLKAYNDRYKANSKTLLETLGRIYPFKIVLAAVTQTKKICSRSN